MILRWILLLRASGIADRDAAHAARIFLVSSFVGSFLPAGVGGDAARAYGLRARSRRGSEALASVAVDRLLGVLSLVADGRRRRARLGAGRRAATGASLAAIAVAARGVRRGVLGRSTGCAG